MSVSRPSMRERLNIAITSPYIAPQHVMQRETLTTFQIWNPSKLQLSSFHSLLLMAYAQISNAIPLRTAQAGRTWRQGSTRRHSFSCSSAAWPGNIEACRKRGRLEAMARGCPKSDAGLQAAPSVSCHRIKKGKPGVNICRFFGGTAAPPKFSHSNVMSVRRVIRSLAAADYATCSWFITCFPPMEVTL